MGTRRRDQLPGPALRHRPLPDGGRSTSALPPGSRPTSGNMPTCQLPGYEAGTSTPATSFPTIPTSGTTTPGTTRPSGAARRRLVLRHPGGSTNGTTTSRSRPATGARCAGSATGSTPVRRPLGRRRSRPVSRAAGHRSPPLSSGTRTSTSTRPERRLRPRPGRMVPRGTGRAARPCRERRRERTPQAPGRAMSRASRSPWRSWQPGWHGRHSSCPASRGPPGSCARARTRTRRPQARGGTEVLHRRCPALPPPEAAKSSRDRWPTSRRWPPGTRPRVVTHTTEREAGEAPALRRRRHGRGARELAARQVPHLPLIPTLSGSRPTSQPRGGMLRGDAPDGVPSSQAFPGLLRRGLPPAAGTRWPVSPRPIGRPSRSGCLSTSLPVRVPPAPGRRPASRVRAAVCDAGAPARQQVRPRLSSFPGLLIAPARSAPPNEHCAGVYAHVTGHGAVRSAVAPGEAAVPGPLAAGRHALQLISAHAPAHGPGTRLDSAEVPGHRDRPGEAGGPLVLRPGPVRPAT